MAAGLNLIPNPGVLVVVAVFFLATIKIVKFYFLEPFYKLQQRREGMTSGGQEAALKRLEEVQARQSDLNQKLTLIKDEAQLKKNALIENTTLRSKAILEKAKREADVEIAEARSNISQKIKAESEKVMPLVDRLADQLFGTLTR